MNEEWRTIVDFPNYEISNLGRIKVLERKIYNGHHYRKMPEKFLKLEKTNNGYLRVQLVNSSGIKKYSVHRLIAKIFINNPKNLETVNHIDGNKLNNNVSNLEWVTQRENNCHKINKNKTSSKYIGVSWYPNRQLWRSSISFENKIKTLGYYKTEEEAYQVRINFEKKNNITNKYL